MISSAAWLANIQQLCKDKHEAWTDTLYAC